MKNAFVKDILRTIQKNAKRFVAIMAITALGLTAFAGITAACRDMYLAADNFYNEQKLFDMRVLSTLGLTEDDVDALQSISMVETADGGYSEKIYTEVDGLRQSAEMTMLSQKGLNVPYIESGRLPQNPGEIAVTQKYITATGKTLGDSIDIEEELENTAKENEENAADETKANNAENSSAQTAEQKTGSTAAGTNVNWDADVKIEEEAETPTFKNTHYTITGVVIDPMNISNGEGVGSLRSSTTTDYTFFVTPQDVDTDVYTSVYVILHGLAGMDTYSAEYAAAVYNAIDTVENEIMKQRQQARYNAVMDEALEKITDAENTMNSKFNEADEAFADAWGEIEKAKKEIVDGEAELTREERNALQKLADARAELADGKAALQAGEAEIATAQTELDTGLQELEQGRQQLLQQKQTAAEGFAQAEQVFAQKQTELDAALATAQSASGYFPGHFGENWPAAEWSGLTSAAAEATTGIILQNPDSPPDFTPGASGAAAATAETEGAQAAFAAAMQTMFAQGAAPPDGMDAESVIAQSIQAALGLGAAQGGAQALAVQKAAFQEQKNAALLQIEAAETEMTAAEKALDEGRQKLNAGRAELAAGWAELTSGEAELNTEEANALKELADGWKELADGKKELADGEAELIENEEKYQDKKAEAEEKLADAYEELQDIDMAQWYVQSRTSLDSYTGLDSDLSSIEAIGRAFPVLFLVVAVLISLTTMTRMVEEERGLIGTYKALGFGSAAIGSKYVIYALLASLLGSAFGWIFGFIALPKLLIMILSVMYVLPDIPLYFDFSSAMFGALIFAASITIATVLVCRSELKQTPAALMRPKAPRAGSRIFLERITPVWRRLKFLNKVTARNLFRYKKRLIMTVVGIAGCTALVLAGFAIRDSVTGLLPRQYNHIYRYDIFAVADENEGETLTQYLQKDNAIADFISVKTENIKVLNSAGNSDTMQMIVVPEDTPLESYIYTPSTATGQLMHPGGSGVLITQNAASLLGIHPEDEVTLQTLTLDRYTATVDGIAENYLGNTVFISQLAYENIFGEYEANAAYAHLAENAPTAEDYLNSLMDEGFIVSSTSTQALREQFSTDFAILNYVIYILLVLAAGLALVVLFTLANTNISERVRELATIKVLGFYDREVHTYANKETLILTIIGVLAGLPLGYVFTGLILSALQMPSIEFTLEISPLSYFLAGIISFSFALLVNLITNRILDKINMVEALKSVE